MRLKSLFCHWLLLLLVVKSVKSAHLLMQSWFSLLHCLPIAIALYIVLHCIAMQHSNTLIFTHSNATVSRTAVSLNCEKYREGRLYACLLWPHIFNIQITAFFLHPLCSDIFVAICRRKAFNANRILHFFGQHIFWDCCAMC